MNSVDGKFLRKVVDGLRKDPDALLAFALSALVVTASAYAQKVEIGAAVVVLLYFGYILRARRREEHAERMAELKLERLDRERGKPLRDRYRKRLAGPQDGEGDTRKALPRGDDSA